MVDPWTLAAASICSAICLRIASFRRGSLRYRLGVSLVAYLLCIGTGGYALEVFGDALVGRTANAISPWLLIILGAVMVLIYRAKGNVARVFQMDWPDKWDGKDRRHG
ncbi:phage holin family protein [Metapseudomonas resinovorans]|uniref:phage holin family protein n=1 Tax=Metapseudomonas resinovorans TaxID=53412 RepID=UPI00042624ED|nr:phage holin family protein [Pseudomonas resinovorans]